MQITLVIIAGLVLAAMGVVIWLLTRPKPVPAPDQSLLMLDQRLHELTRQINQQLEHSRQAAERSVGSVSSQVQNFTQGIAQLQAEVRGVQEQVRQVVSFQSIFSTPKLRGNWGEYSLESALGQYFPGASWHMQHQFSSGEAVDAVLQLPNGTFLPIDSKFNWENFQAMVKADNDIAKDGYRKQFLSDVRKRVDEIAKKYVLPGEGTTDFALMYMPAEAVYYEVIQNMGEADVADYARKNKVILCSPNTFYLTISAVQHWFRDSQFSKQTQQIMKKLATVMTDAGKLGDDFRKLGDHLSDAQSAFERSDKKLTHLVDRTQKVISMSEEPKELA